MPAGASVAAGPTIVFVPAMGVAASFYPPFLDDLARDCDAEIHAVELPGQGTSRERASAGDDFGYREVVEELIPEALRSAATGRPGRPLVLAGHSLGGQLSVLAAGGRVPPLTGIVLIAAGTAHWRAWPPRARWRAWLAVHAIDLVSRVLPWYPGARLGFGGNQARRFMRDWSYNARHGRYRLLGSQRSPSVVAADVRRIRVPVLSVAIHDDPVAPPGAIDELLAHVPAAPLTTAHARGVEVDDPWRRHFSWGRTRSDVSRVVADCVREVSTGSMLGAPDCNHTARRGGR